MFEWSRGPSFDQDVKWKVHKKSPWSEQGSFFTNAKSRESYSEFDNPTFTMPRPSWQSVQSERRYSHDHSTVGSTARPDVTRRHSAEHVLAERDPDVTRHSIIEYRQGGQSTSLPNSKSVWKGKGKRSESSVGLVNREPRIHTRRITSESIATTVPKKKKSLFSKSSAKQR